jgi:hypothetical protein
VSKHDMFRPFGQSQIPIVGQAFTAKGGFATAMIQCGCEAKSPILLIGNAPGGCPACRRVFVVQKFSCDNQTNQIELSVGLVRQTPDAEPAPVPEPAGVQ